MPGTHRCQRGYEVPRTGAVNGCNFDGCWESIRGPPQEHQSMLLTAEPSL